MKAIEPNEKTRLHFLFHGVFCFNGFELHDNSFFFFYELESMYTSPCNYLYIHLFKPHVVLLGDKTAIEGPVVPENIFQCLTSEAGDISSVIFL